MGNLIKRIIFFVTLAACVIGLSSAGWAATYYVSLSGSDSYDGLAPSFVSGTKGPFRTFQRAANKVRAGDTVQIRGGKYVGYGGSWGYTYDGTEAMPVTVTAYPGETVVIDGASHTQPTGAYTPLMQVYGDWYKISDIELRYGSYAGLNIVGDHCTVENVTTHDNRGSGIFASGDYTIITHCRSYNNSMANQYGVMSIGWYSGITLCAGTRYSTIRDCATWHNWGEGLSISAGYNNVIEDCISYDNFTVNIYVSQSVNGVCQRNLSYYTPGNPLQPYASSQNGIYIGDEGKPPDSTGNKIINNLCLGGDRCLLVRGDEAENILIAHNTFANAFGRRPTDDTGCIYFLAGASTGGRFVNNIVLQDDSVPISHLEASGVSFSYNNWSRTPVGGCRGTGDVIANPGLRKTGSTLAGELGPGWFKIQEDSPARDKALVLSQVPEDFEKKARGSSPDMGAFNVSGGTSALEAQASGAPTSGRSPLIVNFTGIASGGSSPYAYSWAFGDGSASTAQNPAHIYATAGRYTATLTVTDDTRTSANAMVAVSVDAQVAASDDKPLNTALSAQIGASSLSGKAPLAVSFRGNVSGGSSPYSYSWKFGDGGASTAQNPSRTYASAGAYVVTLMVTDQAAAMASSTVIVRVTSATASVLSANGLASPSSGRAPLTVRFAGSAGGGSSPCTYQWVFGDGSSSTSQNPTHTYRTPGTYIVTFTARDSSSVSAVARMTVTALSGLREVKRDTRRKPQPRLILR
jgi:PKD repeat protein